MLALEAKSFLKRLYFVKTRNRWASSIEKWHRGRDILATRQDIDNDVSWSVIPRSRNSYYICETRWTCMVLY